MIVADLRAKLAQYEERAYHRSWHLSLSLVSLVILPCFLFPLSRSGFLSVRLALSIWVALLIELGVYIIRTARHLPEDHGLACSRCSAALDVAARVALERYEIISPGFRDEDADRVSIICPACQFSQYDPTA